MNEEVIVDIEDWEGKTPLHHAASNGHEEALCWLLGRGVNLQKWDLRGRTPLHLAAEHGASVVVAILMGKHASSEAIVQALASKDEGGRTPLELAIACKKEGVVEAFVRGLNPAWFVQAAVSSENPSVRVASMQAITEQIHAFQDVLDPVAQILAADQNEAVIIAILGALEVASQLSNIVLDEVANKISHPNWRVQGLAIAVLNRQKSLSENHLQALIKSLDSSREEIQEKAIEAFQIRNTLPENVAGDIEKLLRGGPYAAQAAAKALLNVFNLPGDIFTLLEQCLSDGSKGGEVRAAAAETLRHQASFPHNNYDTSTILNGDRYQRLYVLSALRKRGLDAETLNAILEVLEKHNMDIESQKAALEVLREQESLINRGLQAIVNLLPSQHPKIRSLAAEILQKQSSDFPDEVLQPLRHHLKDASKWQGATTQTLSLKALRGRLECSDDTLNEITDFLDKGDSEARVAAIESLRITLPLPWNINYALITCLNDEYWGVRISAIQTYRAYDMQNHPPPIVIQAIESRLGDKDKRVRKAAGLILKEWGHIAENVTRLTAVLTKKSSASESDSLAAIEVLQNLESDHPLEDEALETLLSFMRHQDSIIRQAAINGILSQRETPFYMQLEFFRVLWRILHGGKELVELGQRCIPAWFLQMDLPRELLDELVRLLAAQESLPLPAWVSFFKTLQSTEFTHEDILDDIIEERLRLENQRHRKDAIAFLKWLPSLILNAELRDKFEKEMQTRIWQHVIETFIDALQSASNKEP